MLSMGKVTTMYFIQSNSALTLSLENVSVLGSLVIGTKEKNAIYLDSFHVSIFSSVC